MQPFSDIDLALEHAKAKANQFRAGQRRAVYLVQHGDKVSVQTNKPLSQRYMLKIKPTPYPKSKPSRLKGVNLQKKYGNYRAYMVRNRQYYHLGVYADYFDACCAKISAENLINKSGVN